MFAECSCIKCGAVDESNFSISGKHIKQSCNQCGAYVKFYPQHLLPSLKDVRAIIWQKMCGSVEAIDMLKKETNFVNYTDYTSRFIQYWKIYMLCRKICGETK